MNTHTRIGTLIDELAARKSAFPKVSVYFKTSVQPDRLKENAIHLKNALTEISRQLDQLEVKSATTKDMITRIEDAADNWKNGSGLDRGMAIFADTERLESVALPFAPDEVTVASSVFYLKPLFNALAFEQRFWLLALSQNRVSLYHGNGFGLNEIDPGDAVPESLQDVVGYQPSGKALQFHAGARGSEDAMFHGQGAGKDDAEPEVRRFLQAVDQPLQALFRKFDAPVVLAGVADLLATYRAVSDASRLLDDQIEGNVEDVPEEELHQRAWKLVRRWAENHRLEALNALAHSDPDVPVARQLNDALEAARAGRVDTAYLADDATCWAGAGENQTSADTPHEYRPGHHDLIDRTAVQTRSHGGTVTMVPKTVLPGDSVALARLRY